MHDNPFKARPLFIIAAVSVIIFSLVRTAAINGQIPIVNFTFGEPAAHGGGSGIQPDITPIAEMRASARRMGQAKSCTNCGIVDSITVNETKRDDRVSNSTPAGHEIDINVNQTVTHQVKVSMDNGTYRIVIQRNQLVFQVGDKVRIINGEVVQLENAKMPDKNGMFALILIALTNRLF